MRPPSRHERRRRAPSASLRAGFTLVEMLVVMGIIATVGVLVVITMASVGERSSREGARENVMDVLRQARMSAMDSGRGSLVRINPSEGTIYGLASTVVAAWHFESVSGGITPGAKSMNGTVTGATVAPGKVGLCLNFTSGDVVNCHQYPVYDQTAGIRLEAWVHPESPPPGVTAMGIIGKGDATAGMSYALGLAWYGPGVGYGVHAGFVIDPPAVPGPGIHLASYNPVTSSGTTLQPNTWHHVAAEFDGFEGRLFIDGRLVDLDSYRPFPEAAPPAPYTANPVADPNPGPAPGTDDGFSAPAQIVPVRSADLTIGSAYIDCPGIAAGTYYFQGLIDEPKLLSVAGGDPVYLPANVPMVLSDPVVHFDPLGRLDLAYHANPVCAGLGDPFVSAKLANGIAAGDLALGVEPPNPFAPTGGFIMVGPEGGPYEAMGYGGTNGTSVSGLVRGLCGSTPVGHALGEKVLFARLVVVDQMGEVKRETLHD